MYHNLLSYLALVLVVAIPLIITAIGGMFTERGGVTNIGLEGLMVIGAFLGILFINKVPAEAVGGRYVLFFLGSLVAALGGVLVSFFHAIAAVKMRADQIISATAINILTPALALFLTFTLNLGQGDKLPINANPFRISEVPVLSKIPFIGDLFFTNVLPSIYVGIVILIAAYIVLYKTKFGLRLRSCGENPHAADAAGINIYRMRMTGVMISGALAGLGGFYLILGFTIEFDANVSGYGFLAIAVLIFGNWKPFNVALSALLFSALLTLSKGVAFFPALENLNINSNVWSMLPYVATIIVLILTSKNSLAPKAIGQIYDKGER